MLRMVVTSAARRALAPVRAFSATSIAQPFTTPVPTPMINLGVLQQPWLRALATDEAAPAMELLNRNARRPKKANHGKRPCSHHRRRQKRLSRRSA